MNLFSPKTVLTLACLFVSAGPSLLVNSRATAAETILVEYELLGEVYRSIYIPERPRLNETGIFWRIAGIEASLPGDRNGVATITRTDSANSFRLWLMPTLMPTFSLIEFRFGDGGEGEFSTTPSFMLLYNEVLDGPPTLDKLAEGRPLSKCEGHLLLNPAHVCGAIEMATPRRVNFMDLRPIQSVFPTGDLDGDFDVDFTDFLGLSANFGARPAASESVPEPASGILVLLCLMLVSRRARR